MHLPNYSLGKYPQLRPSETGNKEIAGLFHLTDLLIRRVGGQESKDTFECLHLRKLRKLKLFSNWYLDKRNLMRGTPCVSCFGFGYSDYHLARQ